MIYAYYRVSTDQQDFEKQKSGVIEFCKKRNWHIDIEVVDKKSGKLPPNKRNLGVVLQNIKQGDIIVCGEISRLGRSLLMLMDIFKIILDKGAKVYTVKEGYELGDNLTSKVLAFAFGLVAELERDLISARTKEALQKLKKQGQHLGRPFGMTFNKLDKYNDYIRECINNGDTLQQISKKCSCTRSTLYRWLLKNKINTNYQRSTPPYTLHLGRKELLAACWKFGSSHKIAEFFGISRNNLYKEFAANGIEYAKGSGWTAKPEVYGDVKYYKFGDLV